MYRRIYHPYTATGKLKADRTPTTPKGFGTGTQSVPSQQIQLGTCLPVLNDPDVLRQQHVRSSFVTGLTHNHTTIMLGNTPHRKVRTLTMSINSCTSPSPSVRIFPISSDTNAPRSSRYDELLVCRVNVSAAVDSHASPATPESAVVSPLSAEQVRS